MFESLEGKLVVVPASSTCAELAGRTMLVIQHSEFQAVALVTDRPDDATAQAVWKKARKKKSSFAGDAWIGGPVEGPLQLLHDQEDLADLTVAEGLYYTAKKKSLDELAQRENVCARVYNSHAGWAPGDLEKIVTEESWSATDVVVEDLLS